MIPIYQGRRRQRGYGVGGNFASFFRQAMPLFKSTGFNIGKEALRTGSEALGALESGSPWKKVAKTHLKKTAKRTLQPLLSLGTKLAEKGINDIFGSDSDTLPRTKKARTTSYDDIFDD